MQCNMLCTSGYVDDVMFSHTVIRNIALGVGVGNNDADSVLKQVDKTSIRIRRGAPRCLTVVVYSGSEWANCGRTFIIVMSIVALLWSPFVIGQTIIFLPCYFFLSSSFFFPRLISAAVGWMSTILWHMVLPYCVFRMQIWKMLHAARWKCRTQKSRQNRHLGTIPQLCWPISSQLRHVSTIGKKVVKQQYLLYMSSQYGERRPTSGWDHFVSLGHPCKFQLVSCLGSVTARHSSIVGVSQSLRLWTEGATYVRQGDHHVGHWPTF